MDNISMSTLSVLYVIVRARFRDFMQKFLFYRRKSL